MAELGGGREGKVCTHFTKLTALPAGVVKLITWRMAQACLMRRRGGNVPRILRTVFWIQHRVRGLKPTVVSV